ncbi:MAG: hypothetical protein IKJ32_01330 [Clostridia bacterium]|nr:hypothetical protein [Clostridia bacterium]
MRQLVKYKYDRSLYDGRIQPNRIYEVTKETIQNGYGKYQIRGLDGWFDARCFEPARPYMALANQAPVVGQEMNCYRFKVCEEDEKGFAGWKMERCTTDTVRGFYRCGEDTYVTFTQSDVYIVQING